MLLTDDQLQLEMDDAQKEEREVSEDAARTIASLWQSPGQIGWALAAYASGAAISWEDVYEDLRSTIQVEYENADAFGRQSLDLLGTYLINRKW